jgi:hypothetical protein
LTAAIDRLETTHKFTVWPRPAEIRAAIAEARSGTARQPTGDYVKELKARTRKHWNEAISQAMRPYHERYRGNSSMLFEIKSVISRNVGDVVQARLVGDPEPPLPRLTDAELEECAWRAKL